MMIYKTIDRFVRDNIKALGFFLAFLALLFVFNKIILYGSEISFRNFDTLDIVFLISISLISGISSILLASGWREILVYVGVDRPFRWAVWAYATSQLAKYVPGNVFQLVGRQALGVAAGISNAPLAKSSVLELLVIAASTILFVPLVSPFVFLDIGLATSLPLFLILAAALLLLTRWLFGPILAKSAAFYASYLAVSGAIFVAAYSLAGGSSDLSLYPAIAGAYVIAWLAGLLTPGAPAGIGVREAVLLFLLDGLSPSSVILLAVVIGRMITVLGDLLFFVGGLIAGRLCEITNEQG
ncbi:hypothetical protein FJ952_05720 [Mesorhizobium sp. B2-4-10]|uniref:hypothetical protein n=1 Tax=Mesorhizobium sp. B2-4-10 TaxID=2589939 RepID=UPI00112AB760|nr:hypothetical protein [Mesorhizobium sp. B2-4-10]TPL22882.1 hypothetical protein FJ952_05720 [Mesorhizobium sp. B2-4-10]